MAKRFTSGSLVTLEHFFEGNTNLGSIGCNLDDHPGIPKFFDVLKRIRSRKNVQDVLVFITETPEESGTDWAFSDHLYLITSADVDTIDTWFEELNPDPIRLSGREETPVGLPALNDRMKVYVVWWD